MAHCTKCGAQVDAQATFCQSCGERQPVTGAYPSAAGRDPATTASPGAGSATPPAALGGLPPGQAEAGPGARSGLQENVAATLSYAAVWVTGIIFLLIDKRPYVQFHAAQSLVLFGGLWLIRTMLGIAMGVNVAFGGWRHMGDWDDWGFGRSAAFGVLGLLSGLIGLAMFVLWILLMVKAYQGERFRIPIAADMADSMVGK